MIIFPDSNLIYFAIPKTGSTVFEQTFETEIPNSVAISEDRKHMNVRQFEYDSPDIPNGGRASGMERMAILREPLERLHSWYRFRRRLDRTYPSSTRDISFEDFIKATMSPSPPPYAQNVGDQWRFCIRKNGKLGITHLFDIANLAPLDEFLQDRLGQGFPRARVNESKSEELVVSNKIAARLRHHRNREFELYESVNENGGCLSTDIQT